MARQNKQCAAGIASGGPEKDWLHAAVGMDLFPVASPARAA